MTTEISAVAAVAASPGGEGHRAAVSAFPAPTAVAEPAAKPPPPAPEPRQQDLKQAIRQLERYIEASRTGLQFRVDRELNRVIVSIVDPSDGTVLRQMPSEEALRLAKALSDEGDGGLLDALV